MPDVTTAPSSKLAMSRALGAAFLSHQVEQLEKSVSAPRNHNSNSNGNWRDRQRPHPQPSTDSKRGQLPIGGIRITTTQPHQQHQYQQKERSATTKKRGSEDAKKANTKEADVIVVDASVLVNALGQIKKWCRDGQEAIIIVPLEALNTLDILKKGSTPLAQRARTASRVLESQVGTNPRVRVQQDAAYVLWDKIAFEEDSSTPSIANPTAAPSSTSPSPEWVRRTICCARWETENADAARPRVVLATLAQQQPQQQQQPSAATDTPQHPGPGAASPVPLPAPHHAQQHRHEPRATGTLVAHWARRARISVLEVPPSGPDGRVSPEDRRPPHHHNHHHRGRGDHHPAKGNGGGMVERPPAVKAMMDVISQPSRVVRVLARGEKLDP